MAQQKSEVSKNIIFSTIVLLFLLGAIEVGWRCYLYNTGRGFFDNPREFTSPFFTTYAEPMPVKFDTLYYYLNGPVNIKKPDNEIRVICFGGSTTVNFRAKISYSEILDSCFSNYPNYNVRVLNAGGEGYSTAHALVNLALRNLDAKPDIITVYFNINDLSASWMGKEITSDYGNKYKTDFFLGMRHRTGLIAGLTKISRFSRFLVAKIDALEYPDHKTNRDRDYSKGLVYFTRNLKNIVAIAHAHNIRVVLISQPADYKQRTVQGFSAFNRATQQVAEQLGVTFVDMASHIEEDHFFLDDGIHYTKEGVAQIAKNLFPVLNNEINLLLGEVDTARALP